MDWLANQLFSFVTSPLGALTAWLLTAFGAIFTFVFYFKSRRIKAPIWDIEGNILIEDYTTTLPGLEVRYQGQTTPNLTVTRLLFYNEGQATIEVQDIAKAAPLTLEATKGAILSAKVIEDNHPASLFAIAANGSEWRLEFDHVDFGNACVVEVVHTGTTVDSIRLTGEVKSTGTVKRKELSATYEVFREHGAPLGGIALFGMFAMTLMWLSSKVPEGAVWYPVAFIGLILCIFLFLLALVLYSVIVAAVERVLLAYPAGIRKFQKIPTPSRVYSKVAGRLLDKKVGP